MLKSCGFYGSISICAGANPIDVTDPKWEIYVAVKRSSENELSNNSKVEMLGFATVYHFFYYPDTSRMRIGQV